MRNMLNLDEFSGFHVLYLTTVGRSSRLPRTIEIWFIAHQGDLYLFAEHHHQAGWVKNIEKNPLVHVRIGDAELEARGRILDPNLDADLWRTVQDLATQKYGWGEGLPVQLTPFSP